MYMVMVLQDVIV